uniref:Pentatricopeptide repeat-containing protein At3g50420 n=1 Tax=Nelumbo nucifera TaxID=4432 RepID=A0A822Z648_NELNU|nr:TPA_asm: hypothetical protein HUJ06_014875 [Nelumbo nucifera]
MSHPLMPSYELAELIERCTSTTSLRKARQLHGLILTSVSLLTCPPPFLYNNILSMYARCCSLEDSQRVFDKMPHRNIVSFNALISAYSRIPSHATSAFRLLKVMQTEGLRPNGSTFSSLLQASSSLQDLLFGTSLHTQVMKSGFFNDLCVQTSLLGMYSNCGVLDFANRVFRHLINKDAIAWNSIIFGNMQNNQIRQGLQLFCRMRRSGSTPTHFTYSMVLNACSRLRDHISGKLIHAQVIKSDLPADVPLQNALLDMYSTCADIYSALCAVDLFIQLQQMSHEKPDEYTYAAIISATGALPASDYGKPLHGLVTKVGYEISIFVGSTLVSMYLGNGETDSAQKLFYSIPDKDIILWTEMIIGHSRVGEGESALWYFHKMREEGYEVDSFALSSALSSCADLATLHQGEIIHSLAIKTGYESDTFVCGSLVDMYAKNGNLQAAQLIFSSISDPDLKCWNSMLGGLCYHGKAEEAFKLYDEILKQGLRPDQITFVSLLSGCNHRGLVKMGWFFWNSMKENNMVPELKHYSCMVSLLGRAGLLQEAKDLISESPFAYDYPELWRILLSSCILYRNLELGIHAAEQILRLGTEDGTTHILLSNLYAAAGRWDAVAEIRKNIRFLMLEKEPGLSWIEIKSKINIFSSCNQIHPELAQAEMELQRLKGNMIRWEHKI